MMPTVVPSDDEDADGDDTEIATNLNADMDLGVAEDTALALSVTEIGAYWLQRAINEAYTKDGESLDATATQAKDKEVLRLLASNSETAQLETDLVFHLDFKRFELIKLLVANRKKIVWCTKLGRAKSDEDKASIEAEMYNDPSLTGILAQLKETRASARDRKNALINEVREEARKLRENEGAVAKGPEVVDSEVAARQVLDLESLQFPGGGHYMADNAKVSVPKESYKKLEKGYEEVRSHEQIWHAIEANLCHGLDRLRCA
jgi:pre-mRNA-splicing helicase BRR2